MPAARTPAPRRGHRLLWPVGPLIALALIAGAAVLLAPSLDDDGREPAGGPPSPGPLPHRLTGVQIHPFFSGQTDATVAREMDIAARAGADSVRVDLVWSSLQLNGPGPFDANQATRVDRVLEAAARR